MRAVSEEAIPSGRGAIGRADEASTDERSFPHIERKAARHLY
jgi:hypothetical protein